jgi:predicted metal-dependent hydrolase
LVVQADGTLLVRAPQRVTNRRIAEIVEEKAAWIRTRQAEALARPQSEAHQFASGEEFWYLGSAYPLWVTQGKQDRLELAGGQFRLSVCAAILAPHGGWDVAASPLRPLAGKDAFRRERAQSLFIAWYRRQARQVLDERVARLAQQCALSYRQVKITSAHTRWGSCSGRGTLSFPWRLVMAPLAVIDYVVVHELVHTVVKGHGHDFWGRVQALMPEYKQHVLWLKENGAMLEL